LDFASLSASFGSFGWSLFFFLLALAIIIPVHELGHYLVGRWTGIGAEVFSFGFGPVLYSRTDRHGTRWQIAAIPFGGFVKFVGDANAASGRDEAALAEMDAVQRRRSVHGAPLWARALTVAAGPVFNFVLAFLIFTGVVMVQGISATPLTVAAINPMPAGDAGDGLRKGDVILAVNGMDMTTEEAARATMEALPDAPDLTYTIRRDGAEMTVTGPHLFPARVSSVMPGSAAADTGFEPGDVILAVDGAPIGTFQQLIALTRASGGKPMVLKVWRDGTVSDFTLVPRKTDTPTGDGGFETRYLIGLTSGALVEGETVTPGPVKAAAYGAGQVWDVMVNTVSGVYHMIAGKISTCAVSGPIGIATISGDAAAAGAASFIMFVGFLSAAIGLMNLFPIPVLDGGHLVFQAWEGVTGRVPNGPIANVLMMLGLAIVIGLMLFGLSNDLLRCP
jgi:regulator of sigma E protease